MRQEGFWYSKYGGNDHFPKPIPHFEDWTGREDFLAKLSVVEEFAKPICFRGYSYCRMCKQRNGSVSFELNEWEWPEGFRHYLEDHNIKPTDEFVRMIADSFQRSEAAE